MALLSEINPGLVLILDIAAHRGLRHFFTVRITQNVTKLCFRAIFGDKDAATHKLPTFVANAIRA
jgi:hypothetical protein